MKNKTDKEKLKLIEEALIHYYDIDIKTLLSNYQSYLDKKASGESKPAITDKKAAIEYFQTIPDNCYKDDPIEMKNEMLSALTEEELNDLCEEQVKSHSKVQTEIRSMFEYCLKIKKLLET